MSQFSCIFCRIVAGEIPARLVYQDQFSIAFLDVTPLFPGHVLLCPRQHCETLLDLPGTLAGPMMANMQLLARAVESAVQAEGTFIAMNNRVSQTVPHLHIHIVPRRRRDGLRGFFWPRKAYRDEEEAQAISEAIASEIKKLSQSETLRD